MLREQAGWRERELELPAGSSIEDAWQATDGWSPALASSRDSVRFARNRNYAAADEQLSDGDELALIPPVAGGARAQPGRPAALRAARQQLEDELLAELRATVPTDADGALVIFVGQTRETPGTPAPGEEVEAARHAGERVTGLDYEAFEEMALDILRTIGAEIEPALRRPPPGDDPSRRTGVGWASRASSSRQRRRTATAAFDAARYAIEELKARAPIWKAEHFADGSVWIGAPARHGAADEQQANREG